MCTNPAVSPRPLKPTVITTTTINNVQSIYYNNHNSSVTRGIILFIVPAYTCIHRLMPNAHIYIY